MNNNVYLLWDDQLIKECDRLPAVKGRASIIHELISAYGILHHIKIVRSSPGSDKDLKLFHAEQYLDHIKTFVNVNDDYMSTSQDEEYGFGYDCQPVSDMFNIVTTLAGGSITAAKCLIMGLTDTVINWCGGWHHAHRFGAEGFCYVNDIVIAIEYLRKKFSKVLYIDLDVHHGNGVQDAYNLSKSVFTLSFHKHEPGFYPGTGHLDDIGTLNGKGFSCNFPLHAAYSDETLIYAFEKVFNLVYTQFEPDAIVVQCGADALSRDPHGGAGVTIKGYSECVRNILDKRKPAMFLGGGGYNFANTARLWTSITALIAGVELDDNIPEHSYWPNYGPDYTLPIQPLLAKDQNTKEYLDQCLKVIQEHIRTYLGLSNLEQKKSNKVEKTKLNNRLLTNLETDVCVMENKNDINKADVYDFTD